MSKFSKLLRYSALAEQQTGKSRLRQIQEAFVLAIGSAKLGPEEYFEFEIFDDRLYAPQDKDKCVGWRASEAIDKRLNNNHWRATANDKVLNYAILQQYGFPIPETLATFSLNGRRVGNERVLTSRQDLENYFTGEMPFPIFIKPIHGSYGGGTWLLKSYNAGARQFTDGQGKSVPLQDLMDSCMKPQYVGMLFQRCLEPHDLMRQWMGDTTSCARVVVILTDDGPQVHMAALKIARAKNINDNFHMGKTGNLLGAVNVQTGAIERVITGFWPDGKSLTHHPDTHQGLIGAVLPGWAEALAMCRSAAVCFPGLAIQNWDIAFCREGPVLMEVNTECELGLWQFVSRKPFVDEKIKSLMQKT